MAARRWKAKAAVVLALALARILFAMWRDGRDLESVRLIATQVQPTQE